MILLLCGVAAPAKPGFAGDSRGDDEVHLAAAERVFEGHVIAVVEDQVRFRVTQVWRGPLSEEVVALELRSSHAVHEGEVWLVYAKRAGNTLIADETSAPTRERRDALAALGPGVIPYDLSAHRGDLQNDDEPDAERAGPED